MQMLKTFFLPLRLALRFFLQPLSICSFIPFSFRLSFFP